MIRLNLAILIISVIIYGCKDEPEVPVHYPSNLQIKLTSSATIPGKVDAKTTANDVNFFTFVFEDSLNTETIESIDGQATHQYANTGTYTVRVKAHALAANFIEASDTISVYIEGTTNADGKPINGYSTSLSQVGYTLVWNDEFNGTVLDESSWNFEIGNGSSGWGNNELQYYRKENTLVKDGYLSIEAKQQGFASSLYTSSRLTTQGKKSFKYGRIDIRAAMPQGQGMWPALWMLGDNISSVGWPKCGEIDIMEMVGGTANGKSDNTTHGTLHWDQNNERASFGGNKTIGTKLADEFHVYSIIWEANSIKWYLDDVLFHTADISSSNLNEFLEKFFFIINVAVGGDWPGSPDASTTFPQKMWVDYIRVFQ
jgi:beta-glucanase (GH16 family)